MTTLIRQYERITVNFNCWRYNTNSYQTLLCRFEGLGREMQYKLSSLVSLSAGLGQRLSINKQNGGLGYLVFGCPLTSFVLRKRGLFEFIFLSN